MTRTSRSVSSVLHRWTVWHNTSTVLQHCLDRACWLRVHFNYWRRWLPVLISLWGLRTRDFGEQSTIMPSRVSAKQRSNAGKPKLRSSDIQRRWTPDIVPIEFRPWLTRPQPVTPFHNSLCKDGTDLELSHSVRYADIRIAPISYWENCPFLGWWVPGFSVLAVVVRGKAYSNVTRRFVKSPLASGPEMKNYAGNPKP